ncbi:MAG: PfkB family carbohydrate kinase [Alphaproteobacteria bacterium]|nr:PfkB family carbohydrate kinase [Alphaproteobacteria bacterium]
MREIAETVRYPGSVPDLRRICNEMRQGFGPEETVGFVSGNFNVLHLGHLRLLKFASESADRLVVGLNPDGPREVTVPFEARREALDMVSFVDCVLPLDQPLTEALTALKPDIIVKGAEHKEHFNVEQAIVDSYGGRLIFGSGDVAFSESETPDSDFSRQPPVSAVPSEYIARHSLDLISAGRTVAAFSGLRVTVIGDLIVDSYIACEPIGMSQEDPTIVVTPQSEKRFTGGAGAVAGHARSLGASVSFLTVVGRDEIGDVSLDGLEQLGVQVFGFRDPTRPTPLKRRYRAHGKTLLRVNELRQHDVDETVSRRIVEAFDAILEKTDLLLFSDFNYGCLPQALVDTLSAEARRRNVMMAADSQASSQFGDISRFKGMNLITPTEHEARLSIRDFNVGLASTAEKLKANTQAGVVAITLGGNGLLVRAESDGEAFADRLPALCPVPVDTAGAGDSLFTSMSMSLCTGASPWLSALIGSVAASCQVSRIGNKPLQQTELIDALRGAMA